MPAGRTVLPPSDLWGRGDASLTPCGRTTASASGDSVGVCDGFLNAGEVCWGVDAARGRGRRVVCWRGGMGEGEACRVYAYKVVVGHCGCDTRRRREKEQARGVSRQGKWEMGTGKEKRKARIGQHTFPLPLLVIPHIHIQIPNWAIYSPPRGMWSSPPLIIMVHRHTVAHNTVCMALIYNRFMHTSYCGTATRFITLLVRLTTS